MNKNYNVIDTYTGKIWSSYDDMEEAMDTVSELNANEVPRQNVP